MTSLSVSGRWLVRRSVVASVAELSVLAVDLAAVAPAASAAPAPVAAAAVRPAPVTARPDPVSAMVSARAQGSRVEIESERTETSTTLANPSGTLTTEAHAGTVRFRDGAGVWQPVDLNLAAQPVAGVAAAAISARADAGSWHGSNFVRSFAVGAAFAVVGGGIGKGIQTLAQSSRFASASVNTVRLAKWRSLTELSPVYRIEPKYTYHWTYYKAIVGLGVGSQGFQNAAAHRWARD